jgi:hypothetical protein
MARLDVKKGDRFVQQGDARWPMFIEVTRVARAGSWCDIRCYTWAVMWTKRLPEGINGPMADPASTFYLARRDWTMADVEASEPDGPLLVG